MKVYRGSKINTLALRPGEVAVTVYEVTKCYGGPEEGGWWYNWQEAVQVTVFRSLRKARVYMRQQFALARIDAMLRRKDYDHYNESCLAHAERYGLDPDSVGSLDYPADGFIVMEFPGNADPVGSDGYWNKRTPRLPLLSGNTTEVPHYC